MRAPWLLARAQDAWAVRGCCREGQLGLALSSAGQLGQVRVLRVPFRAASFSIRFLVLFVTQLAVTYFSSSSSLDRASVFGDRVISVAVGSDFIRLGISPNRSPLVFKLIY